MNPISDKLISWYQINKRDLPWRDSTDPYKIWLSEIILQQTQVAQGLKYYLKFIENFPNVIALANADEDSVMRLWEGLGYYSRARNLHFTAKLISSKFKGVFPNTYVEIKQLKGVGDYTAAAISSFAFKLPHAVVDGNVYRVLSRLFNIETPINSSLGKKEFQQVANDILNSHNPDFHNSAIMEFGALFCKPHNPDCSACPLQENCLAYKNETVIKLPVKINKTKIKDRYFNYFIFNYKTNVYVRKRKEKDIWQNLYEFYLIETPQIVDENELLHDKNLRTLSQKFLIQNKRIMKKHILTHQHIYAIFYELELQQPLKIKSFIKIKRSELVHYAFPKLINNYLIN